jgi:hypothetical protein
VVTPTETTEENRGLTFKSYRFKAFGIQFDSQVIQNQKTKPF